MNWNIVRIAPVLFLLAIVLRVSEVRAPTNWPDLVMGLSTAEVDVLSGQPKGRLSSGATEVWNYDSASLTFVSGRVTKVDVLTEIDLRQRARERWESTEEQRSALFLRDDAGHVSNRQDAPWSEVRDGLKIRLTPIGYELTNGVWQLSARSKRKGQSADDIQVLVEFQNVSTQAIVLADPDRVGGLAYKCMDGGGRGSGYSWDSDFQKLNAEDQWILSPGEARTFELDEDMDDACDYHDLRFLYRAPYGMPGVWTNRLRTPWARLMAAKPEHARPQPWNRLGSFRFSEGMAPVLMGNRWDYINTNGVCVIAPRYREVTPFVNGMAVVHETADGAGIPIDRAGKRLDMEYPFSERRFFDGLALKVVDGLAGYVDERGRFVIPPTWPFIKSDSDVMMPQASWTFSNGLASIVVDGLVGFIDVKGAWRIPPTFKAAHMFSDGRALVQRNEGFGFIDTNGNPIGEIYTSAYPFREGRAAVYVGGACDDDWESWWPCVAGGKWGCIDRDGVMVIPPRFERIHQFENGVTFAWLDGKPRVIDREGTFLAGPDIEHVLWTGQGLISVQARERKGFMNTSGQIVVPVIYEDVQGFSEGLAAVKSNDRWGFVNSNGVVIVPCQFMDTGYYTDGIAPVRDGGKWGLINTNGEFVVPTRFDDIHYRSFEGYWAIEENGKWGYIDSKGRCLWRPTK